MLEALRQQAQVSEHSAHSVEDARRAVAEASVVSVWDVSRPPPKRRTRRRKQQPDQQPEQREHYDTGEDGDASGGDEEDEGRAEQDEQGGQAQPSWEPIVRVRPGELARHALRIGAECLNDESCAALDALAPVFFRNTVANISETLLMKDGEGVDHQSLSVNAMMAGLSLEQRDKKLLALAQAGESEAGQQIVRDLVLSFLLPSGHVGVRRTLLLSRAASTQAGIDHPEIVARAHDVAMSGSEWMWLHGTDELERMCCLLAGLALMTTKQGEDPVRKGNAFGGRVVLPFFETAPPPPTALRLALIPTARRWVLFSIGKNGQPKIELSQRGFQGFCTGALKLVASLK
jgi:hypothetical protein